MDEKEEDGVDCKDAKEVPGEVGGCPGGGRWGLAGVDDPRALALGEQAEQEGGGGGGGGGEEQPGHREEEAGNDCDVQQVGLGGEGGRLEEESQAGGEQGKMARKWERGVEGDGGQQPGEGEHQVESHPGRKQISDFFTIFFSSSHFCRRSICCCSCSSTERDICGVGSRTVRMMDTW